MSRDPLARFIPKPNADDGEIRQMAAAAWHRKGFICLRPEEIRNEIDRMVVERVAERLYGKRSQEKTNCHR